MRNHGPVETLCREIEFPWRAELERTDVFISFVRSLVREVSDMRCMQSSIAHLTLITPSKESGKVLALSNKMLAFHESETADMIKMAARVHDLCHELNPDEKTPTDHLIDMYSSCASAIRFGLETSCSSRHAASAAQHVWERKYGLQLFDGHTPAWEKEWARSKMTDAIIALLPPPFQSVDTEEP